MLLDSGDPQTGILKKQREGRLEVREFGKTRSACNTFMMLQRLAGVWYSVREGETKREAASGRRKPRGERSKGTEGEKRQKKYSERRIE